MFSWLRDIRLTHEGIAFVLFRAFTVYSLPPENIQSVRRFGHVTLTNWDLLDFRSRIVGPSYVLTLHKGWFARKVAVSPPDDSSFLRWVTQHRITYLETPYP